LIEEKNNDPGGPDVVTKYFVKDDGQWKEKGMSRFSLPKNSIVAQQTLSGRVGQNIADFFVDNFLE
jgi:hypothetical protein